MSVSEGVVPVPCAVGPAGAVELDTGYGGTVGAEFVSTGPVTVSLGTVLGGL